MTNAYVKEIFFVYRITGFTYSRLIFRAKTLKRIGQIQFVSELRILTEKPPSKKNPTLSKSMNINIWVVITSNQHFIYGSYTRTKFLKK